MAPPIESSLTPAVPLTAPDTSPRPATRATPAGTQRFHSRAPQRDEDFCRELPRHLAIGALGLGTYLGDCTDEEDAAYTAMVRDALAAGVNLFDTAINYRCQRSERAVGKALTEAIASGEVRRDEVVVCSKGGYVAFDGEAPPTREAYAEWLERELFGKGIVTPDELVRGGHAITPSHLAHQLDLSRANLGLKTIDIYHLHNPEEQLLGTDRATFRTRMRAAFTFLEERATEGVIAGYGCATWTGLRVPPDHRQHLSLAELVALAREVGGTAHHFRAVQLPLSLAMPEAARLPTQLLARKLIPLLEAADALGVAVIGSAPLMQGRLASGLPDELHALFPGCTTDAQRALRFAASMPGVNGVLAGMRRKGHLSENLAAWAAAH